MNQKSKQFSLLTIILFFILSAHTSFGQNDSDNKSMIVEDMPLFYYKGSNNFRFYVQDQVSKLDKNKYPNIKGKVYVKFLINFYKKGSKGKGIVDSVMIARDLHPKLDSIALEIIKASPPWHNAKSRGKSQNLWMIVPVEFKGEKNK